MEKNINKLLVVDFGSQYAHLIAKRFRKLGYYTEIVLPENCLESVNSSVKGIILSGGPSSVYLENAPTVDKKILDLKIPLLGLCYGHQLIAKLSGGNVDKATVGEFGYATLNKVSDSKLFENITFPAQVWMSHSDEVTDIPSNCKVIASTKDCKYASLEYPNNIFSLQFHAEVVDTPIGMEIFKNFAKICNMPINWDTEKVYKSIIEQIKNEAKDKKVLLFLSGGVDSSVAFTLLNKALGQERVLGLHINNGFMRKNESEEIEKMYKKYGFNNFIVEDASQIFLKNVGNEIDPQKKRKIIGETFIEVRDNLIRRLNLNEDEWLLAQGTLYPDIIESGGTKHSHTIKTHHNRVEGIQKLIEKGLIIEPLKDLYKDEVRIIGKYCGLDDEIVFRHPFPGPGISINLICSNIKQFNELEFEEQKKVVKDFYLKDPLKDFFSQYSLDILPLKSVGVQGDYRTYNYPVILRINENINWDKLELASSFITNNLKNSNRVVLSLFEKENCKLIDSFVSKERLDMIREVDYIVIKILKENNYYNKIFQHLTISIPYASKSENCSIVLRPVVSEDVMTARFAKLELLILDKILYEIKKLNFVDCIFYDITNKPPATFGWE